MIKSISSLLTILCFVGCAVQKPAISTAPSFAGVRNSVNDTSKNIVKVQGHLHRARTLAEEADYKLMKAAGFK
jgi:hypothetical protein